MKLTEKQVAALVAWATEAARPGGVTAYGPKFNAAMVVAQSVRVRAEPRPTRGKKALVLAVGQTVRWSSQAAGSWREKVGVVVEVVPPQVRPTTRLSGGGWERSHESYVVEACKVGETKLRMYWPRASALEMVGS